MTYTIQKEATGYSVWSVSEHTGSKTDCVGHYNTKREAEAAVKRMNEPKAPTKTFDNTEGQLFTKEALAQQYEGKTYEPWGAIVLIKNQSGEAGIMYNEIVLKPVEDGKVTFMMYEKVEGGISMVPALKVTMDMEDLQALPSQHVKLAHFTAGRRWYNARLRNNEREVTEWLNQ